MNNKVRPLISVITVVFNAVSTIEQTINSVLNQSYSNVEYIIIDGGSTDGTIDIINKYINKISYFVSEPDKGIYNAMNKGIKQAHGELVGIINADDWYELNAIDLIVSKYLENKSKISEFILYGMLRIWKDGKEYCIRRNHHNFVTEHVIQHPTCFVPLDLYKKHGLFDENFLICADYDLLNRFNSKKVSFINIDKVIANFREGGATTKFFDRVVLEPLVIKLRYGIISRDEFNRAARSIKYRNIFKTLKRFL